MDLEMLQAMLGQAFEQKSSTKLSERNMVELVRSRRGRAPPRRRRTAAARGGL